MRKRTPVFGIHYRYAWKSSRGHRRAVKESLSYKRARLLGAATIGKRDRAHGH